MSSNFQSNRNNDRGNRQTPPVWDVLTNFSYNPASVESWFRLAAQVCAAGLLITTMKALDGDVCGQPWGVWLPQTWGIPSGCFVRSLVKNVPDSFLDRGSQSKPEDIVEPIQMGADRRQPAQGNQQRRGEQR